MRCVPVSIAERAPLGVRKKFRAPVPGTRANNLLPQKSLPNSQYRAFVQSPLARCQRALPGLTLTFLLISSRRISRYIPHAPLRAAGAMPRIKSFAPGWLNHPAPGHNLFALTPEDNTQPASVLFKKTKPGPRRTIARRGTEIFVAVGKQIRWGDLALLKENWDSQGGAGRIKRQATDGSFEVYDEEANGHSVSAAGYRVRSFGFYLLQDPLLLLGVSANLGPRSSSKLPSRTTFGS